MRPAWRLAINSLSERRSRTALLSGAVALSAALIVSVACAMASAHAAINHQLAATVGAADLRIKPASAAAVVTASLLDTVRGWPEVAAAAPRLQGTLAVSVKRPILESQPDGTFARRDAPLSSTALGNSIGGLTAADRPADGALAPDPAIIAGRLPRADNEIVIDSLLAYRLSFEFQYGTVKRDGFIPLGVRYRETPASGPVPERTSSAEEAARFNGAQQVRIGDEIAVVRQLFGAVDRPLALPFLRAPVTLRVVGIAAQPPLGGRPQAYMTLSGLSRLIDAKGLTQIDIAIHPGANPDAVAAAHRADLPASLLLETTDKITSGLDKNMQSSQLGMVLATVMAFLSAAFIITTGLTTAVAERQRELAILRCVGGTRAQLAATQVIVGAAIGLMGAAAGIPLGIAVTFILAAFFRDQLPLGAVVSPAGVALGLAGSVLAGVAGAAWPAWRASRMSPLLALASRASLPTRRGLGITTLAGVLCILYQLVVVGLPGNGQVVFWAYATTGLPAMFVGYFLLGVPAALLLARLLGPVVSRLLRLPRRLLTRTITATPYRHGFTAGALMGGLALLVAIWTNGGAMLRDWLDKIQFPDAFVSGVALTEDAQRQIAGMTDVVRETCAISLLPVETDSFGVRALQQYKTTFVGFEPEPFFRMTTLKWVQGDPATALRRLQEGGAVIVAREFLIAKGLGVGHRFVCGHGGRQHEFEIVGVVASPGLEVVSKFFNVGEDYTDQALHAVFGSRDDLKSKFFAGEPAPIQLIQIQFGSIYPGTEGAILERIRHELMGAGILDVGSGRDIKERIRIFASGTLLVFSTIAVVSMFVACFGVANLIIASIDARRFELGVLRAVGAQRGLLARLIIGEALLIALTAAVLGTLMGIQGSWAGQRLYGLLLGLSLNLRPPPLPIAVGWAAVILLTLGAAWPAIWRLNRKRPRDLLASARG